MAFGLDDPREAARMTAHEWVRERLRRAIFAGDFPPGTRLVQTDIAAQLGVSVTPVREAMRDLINEGMISFDPHKAARVREVELDEAVEIHDLRMLLESEAVRKAAPLIQPDAIDELAWLQGAMEGPDVDDTTWLELNHRWHMIVIEAANSPRLAEILSNLRLISRFYLAVSLRAGGGNRDKSSRDHWDMIEAFRQGDAATAERIMKTHMPGSDELRARVESMGSGETPAPERWGEDSAVE